MTVLVPFPAAVFRADLHLSSFLSLAMSFFFFFEFSFQLQFPYRRDMRSSLVLSEHIAKGKNDEEKVINRLSPVLNTIFLQLPPFSAPSPLFTLYLNFVPSSRTFLFKKELVAEPHTRHTNANGTVRRRTKPWPRSKRTS